MNHHYLFGTAVTARVDPAMDNETVKKLWSGFCFGCSALTMGPGAINTFVVGEASLPMLPAGKEYALSVTQDGIAVVGRDYGGLMRGFIALLMKIDYITLDKREERLRIACCQEVSGYVLKNRMLHLCIFPETDLHFLKRIIRLAGVCQFTHVVIEFWGMLQYDTLKELAWPEAYTKEQIRPIIQEIRELGMEPVPMLNQLGHASQSRAILGKHVVLDQNPRLQPLFTPDGWAWNIYSDRVKKLLKDLRAELYELFGPGEYIHIGCDEADYYTFCEETWKDIPKWLHELTYEVVSEGRRPMMWMDMLLEAGKYKGCFTTCQPDQVEARCSAIAKETVMVDWQYDAKEVPVPTLEALKDLDFDIMGAPWYNAEAYAANVDTLAMYDMHGVMMTTWHVLNRETPAIIGVARKLGASLFPWEGSCHTFYVAASMLRRISFEGNSYADCGWKKAQIEV